MTLTEENGRPAEEGPVAGASRATASGATASGATASGATASSGTAPGQAEDLGAPAEDLDAPAATEGTATAAPGGAGGPGASGATGATEPAPAPEPRSPQRRDAAVDWAQWWHPRLPLDGQPRRPWREQVLVGAAELSRLAIWMGGRTDPTSTPANGALADADTDVAIHGLLRTAEDAARGVSIWPAARRARMERAFGALDAAETALLRRAPDCYLRGRQSALRAHVTAHLPPEHPQRKEVCELDLEASPGTPLDDVQREVLAAAHAAAARAARREHARLRSFRTILSLTAMALLVLAVGIAVLGALRPAWMPLCFAPAGADAVVCPTSTASLAASEAPPTEGQEAPSTTGPVTATDAQAPAAADVARVIAETAEPPDAALVMLLGLAAAAVTGAAALRRMRGTSTPFAVPVALLALKLPTGALTAFFGLLLIHGQIVPGLSALDSSGQILAWALLFGAAQQLVTGSVDKKAQSVLDRVGPAPMTEDQE